MENCLLAITLGKCNKQGLGSRDFLTCRLLQSWSHFLWDRAVYLTILSFYFQRFIGVQGFLKALLWSLWLELGAGWSASWQRPETQPWATVFLLSPNVRSQSCPGGVPGILPAAPEWWVFSSEHSELTVTHTPFSCYFSVCPGQQVAAAYILCPWTRGQDLWLHAVSTEVFLPNRAAGNGSWGSWDWTHLLLSQGILTMDSESLLLWASIMLLCFWRQKEN